MALQVKELVVPEVQVDLEELGEHQILVGEEEDHQVVVEYSMEVMELLILVLVAHLMRFIKEVQLVPIVEVTIVLKGSALVLLFLYQ